MKHPWWWTVGSLMVIFSLCISGMTAFAQIPPKKVYLPLLTKHQSGTPPTSICDLDPNPLLAPNTPIRFDLVNKITEDIHLRNMVQSSVSLDGWVICSINGNEEFEIPRGFNLAPNVILYFGADIIDMWHDTESDDAALYDASGRLIAYLNN